MASQPNDPAQLLASLLEGGQAMMMRHFGMPVVPQSDASDPIAQFFAATQQVANMQLEFWKQATYWATFPTAQKRRIEPVRRRCVR